MPRLPDQFSAGQGPGLAVKGVSPPDLDLGAQGRGMQALAQGISSAGDSISNIARQDQQQQDALDLIKAETSFRSGLYNTQNGLANDADYESHIPRFQESMNSVIPSAAENIKNEFSRKKFELHAQQEANASGQHIYQRADALRKQDQQVQLTSNLTELQTQYDNAPNDVERDKIFRSINDSIAIAQHSRLISPVQAQKDRETYALGSALQYQQKANPEGFYKQLSGQPYQGRQSPDLAPSLKPYHPGGPAPQPGDPIAEETAPAQSADLVAQQAAPGQIAGPTPSPEVNETQETAPEKDIPGRLVPSQPAPALQPSVTGPAPAQIQPPQNQPISPKVGTVQNPFEQGQEPQTQGAPQQTTQAQSQPAGVTQQTLDFIKSREGFAPRATWDYQQYSGGYGTKAQRGQTFTREQAEAALQVEAGKVDGWLQNNVEVPLTENQRTALTSFGFNVGTGGLDRLLPDINGGNWDRVARRMQSFNKAGGEVNEGLVNRRGLESALISNPDSPNSAQAPQNLPARVQTAQNATGTATDATTGGPLTYNGVQLPKLEGHLSGLSDGKRLQLLQSLEKGFQTKNQEQAASLTQQIASDTELLKKTGNVSLDSDGMTSIERARGILPAKEWAKLVTKWNAAQRENAVVSPLQNMSDTEQEQHLENWSPKGDSKTENYKIAQDIHENARGEFNRISNLRQDDPAKSVDDRFDKEHPFVSPEVAAAKDAIKNLPPVVQLSGLKTPGQTLPPQKAIETLLDARMAAQERHGIPERLRSPITQDEADKLLQMRDPKSLDLAQFPAAIKEAGDRAEKIYGPKYAAQALQAAVNYKIKDSTEKMIAAGIISELATKGRVDPDKLQMLDAARQLDPSATFVNPVSSRPDNSLALPAAAATLPTLRPNKKQIELLQQNPNGWQTFDHKFGPGASAHILGFPSGVKAQQSGPGLMERVQNFFSPPDNNKNFKNAKTATVNPNPSLRSMDASLPQ